MEEPIKDTRNIETVSLAYEREKDRRRDTESMLQKKARDLQLSEEQLQSRNYELGEASKLLEQQTGVIRGLTSRFGDVTKELQLAATVQQNMLPEPLLIPSIHAAGKFRPAQYLAGDGYDFHLINDTTFAFYIVDVAGHGVASALVSFAIQKHLNSKKSSYGKYERRTPEPLDKVVLDTIVELNSAFCLHEIFLQFFTIVYGQIDLTTGQLSYCQAGHPAPLIRNASDGLVAEYGAGGFPAGMFIDSEFTVHQHQLKENDRLVIYSDGVTDCEAKDGAEYGLERLMLDVSRSASLGVVDATNHIEDELLKWQDSPVFGDDVSLLVIDYKGDPERIR